MNWYKSPKKFVESGLSLLNTYEFSKMVAQQTSKRSDMS